MKRWLSCCLTIVCLVSLGCTVRAESELKHGYFTLVDSQNRVITRTSHQIFVGDNYLDSSNRLYRVIRLKKQTAICKFVRTEKLEPSGLAAIQLFFSDLFRAETKTQGPVAIYHTHSDESYTPSDGTSSRFGNGGIFQVGDSLTKAFENVGVPVVHSKTSHDPHDAMAYDRSRRTAFQLLKDNPRALLDVHRDAAVPNKDYTAVVNNQTVTKVQLVLGQQNPNFNANFEFAKQIKAAVDKKTPGLIKGIFYGKGKYNQDLGPRAMLLELGTDTSNKGAAERGAQIFAQASKDVIYGSAGAGVINRGSFRSLFWIVAAAVGGIVLFLLLNRSDLKDIPKEFTGAVGEEKPQTDDEESKSDRSDNS